jgi:hypothetical protein
MQRQIPSEESYCPPTIQCLFSQFCSGLKCGRMSTHFSLLLYDVLAGYSPYIYRETRVEQRYWDANSII